MSNHELKTPTKRSGLIISEPTSLSITGQYSTDLLNNILYIFRVGSF